MKDIFWLILLGITLFLFTGLYLIRVWTKEKRKLFQEQVKEAFDNAHKLADIYKKPFVEKLNVIKDQSNKKYMEQQLRVKLETEDKIKNVDDETLNKLMATGLKRDEAIKMIKD